MPVVIRLFGYKIYFWTNEGNPLEPVHVHVSETPHQNATKIWILSSGKIKLANNNSNIPKKDLIRICKTVEEFSDDIVKNWKEIFEKTSYYDKVNSQNKGITR